MVVCSAEYNTSVQTFSTTNKTEESKQFEQIYSFDSNGKIEIRNINGSHTIEAWDNPQNVNGKIAVKAGKFGKLIVQ